LNFLTIPANNRIALKVLWKNIESGGWQKVVCKKNKKGHLVPSEQHEGKRDKKAHIF
jgi:hypothetical protein